MKTIIKLAFFFSALAVSAQSVNVMTYNIRYDNPGDGINQWSSRKEKVFDLVKKYDPDIFGVQEALHHQLNDIRQNLPQYEFIGVGRDDGKEKGEHSAIFYKKDRFDILKQNTFWLSETPEVPGSKNWDAAITRVATWAQVLDKKSDTEFLMINTHFDHIGKESRANSAKLLREKANALGKNAPVIITGDFNCTPDQPPYQTMMDKSGVVLNDPAPKVARPGTSCGFAVNARSCNHIDYIFHSNAWTADNYMIISDNDGKNYPSDHLPVMVRLTLQ